LNGEVAKETKATAHPSSTERAHLLCLFLTPDPDPGVSFDRCQRSCSRAHVSFDTSVHLDPRHEQDGSACHKMSSARSNPRSMFNSVNSVVEWRSSTGLTQPWSLLTSAKIRTALGSLHLLGPCISSPAAATWPASPRFSTTTHTPNFRSMGHGTRPLSQVFCAIGQGVAGVDSM
jgi:hypothetical protein